MAMMEVMHTKVERVPPGKPGRDNNKLIPRKRIACKPIDRRKLDTEVRFERDKQRIIRTLIDIKLSHDYDVIATIEGAIEAADHFVYTSSLTTRERRSMQKRLNRFIVTPANLRRSPRWANDKCRPPILRGLVLSVIPSLAFSFRPASCFDGRGCRLGVRRSQALLLRLGSSSLKLDRSILGSMIQ